MGKYTNADINHVVNGKLEYLEFKRLNELGVLNLITLRHGGVSKGEIGTLNFRILGDDKKENVLENLNIIKKEKHIDHVYKGKQNHTDKILILNNSNKQDYEFDLVNVEEFDGYITNEKNIASLITTADCNPIIIYDKDKKVLANVHSGWKGTTQKIYEKAIHKMIHEFNSKVEDLTVCIGPSISKCCFSSEDENFKKIFTDIWPNEKEYISYEGKKFFIDLKYLIKKDLENMGVKEIITANICTVCNSNDFFSYRVAKSVQDDYGLMAIIAMIK